MEAKACWRCSGCGLMVLFPDFMSDVNSAYRTVGFIVANPDDGTDVDQVKELVKFYAPDCEHQRVYSVMQS